jgi:hypothetical protein
LTNLKTSRTLFSKQKTLKKLGISFDSALLNFFASQREILYLAARAGKNGRISNEIRDR